MTNNNNKKIIEEKDAEIDDLREKVHFYHSEMVKYKQKMLDLSKKMEELEEIKHKQQLQVKDYQAKDTPILGYFSHATFVDQDIEDQLDVVGHFTFLNISDITFVEPILCFRVTPVSSIQLGGKISLNTIMKREESHLKEEWIYVQKDWLEWVKHKGEHWIKPLHLQELKPFQQGRFANFNISIKLSPEHSHYLIEGFVFARNEQQGVPAVNTISIYT